ncbi:MAG: DUF4910 domain-containing protein [Thermoanaerobaculia bacterium]
MKRVAGGAAPLPYVLLLAASAAAAQDRVIPFWPNDVPAAIHAEVDGVAVLETVRELSRFHRVQGSPGFAAAAEHMRKKALAAGLADAAVERFPADGKTRYAHFRSYLGWDPRSGTLEEISPTPRLHASFSQMPVALADYSQDADVTAELVDVGKGTSPADYQGKDVRGKIVLADGDLPTVHRLACMERGAAGFLSDYPNQTTAWSGDDRDLVRWGHLDPYQTANRFAFMVSKRQAQDFRERLARGRIVLRARVAAKMVPATYDVVVATIPGADPAAGEIVLTAHLCHQSAGANDNASGSAVIFEIARALQIGIQKRTFPRPKRTIRFLWVPEIAGSQVYLIRHPEVAKRLVAGVHMDMVGGLLATTKGTLHISRTAESLPHVANEIARFFLDEVAAASARYAEQGGDPYAGFVWLPGSREPLLADLRPLELGSDHQVFQDSTFAVPMLYFHDWPDVTIHTNKDQPENLDATKLGRVAYVGAGIAWTLAALPDAEAPQLLAAARAGAGERIARAGAAAGPDAPLVLREAAAAGAETLASVAALWPSTSGDAARESERLHRLAATPAVGQPADPRIPARNPEIRGPLDVYYSSYVQESIDPAGAATLPSASETVLYEAFNLVNGRRSVSQIRDILAGRYGSAPLPAIAAYFELLAKAGALTLSP